MIFYFLLLMLFLIIIFLILLHFKKTNNVLEESDYINYMNMNTNRNMNTNMNSNSELDTYINSYNNMNESDSLNENLNENLNILDESQVPNLTTDQCYKSRFFECPIVNGSFLQCTNNYIPKPKEYNADCGNRTFEMVPYPWKISENNYYNKINFNRDKVYGKVKFV